MKRRIFYSFAVLVFLVLLILLVWQGSFPLGHLEPTPEQTFTYWAVSLLIFVLTVTLAFMLIRTAVKLSVERHQNREGSRIKTKLVAGALTLSVIPVFFLFVFGYAVFTANMKRWFTTPSIGIGRELADISQALDREQKAQAIAQARYLALLPEVRQYLAGSPETTAGLKPNVCGENDLEGAYIERSDGVRLLICGTASARRAVRAEQPISVGNEASGKLVVLSRIPVDVADKQARISEYTDAIAKLQSSYREIRRTSLQILGLITLFVLFVSVWTALLLSRQISVPISALLAAAQEVRSGNLAYRIRVGANDELASLVRAFNEMTQDLEANGRELERRRLLTEAILESIPTGVISLSSDGRILKVNRALKQIFTEDQILRASRLSDLFSPDDLAELRYMMNRARRTGAASSQIELHNERQVLHLAVTMAALADRTSSVFVLVLEDTSELLRAQKAAAWHEVARRVAHEIKNPLTPISLCAERIARQLEKPETEDQRRILRECSVTIGREVESLKTLVDEFSQFSRFPASQLGPADLNETIDAALQVFQDRLEGIKLTKELIPNLPAVNIDKEQFKRVIVNLVDNAAEAMQSSLVRELYVATRLSGPDTVEILVADSGCGISAEDKEKLFLPYFSTKGRGTGLGLAIVSRILADHNATIRVEDNRPAGAKFLIELPALALIEPETSAVETPA